MPRWIEELLSGTRRELRGLEPRTLTLAEYQALVVDGGRPDDDQCRDFVEDVALAHSWYKHLDMNPPGNVFTVHFDPQAGRAVGWDRTRGFWIADRPAGAAFLHYNLKPTSEYRRRFGWLAYHVGAGTHLARVGQGVPVPALVDAPVVFSDAGEALAPPPEVLAAGAVGITGWIHPYAVERWFGDREVRAKVLRRVRWPETTMPPEAFAQLARRCAEMDDEERRDPGPELDAWNARRRAFFADLDPLVRPERERQRARLLAAVRRVRALVFG